MDKKRFSIQSVAALAQNAHIKGFFTGKLYQGPVKGVCVPGLNCYSCPGAVGACPIGSLQSFLGGLRFRVPYYVLGFLLFFGALLGRTACGFLCPFGWLQEMLHAIPFFRKTDRFALDRPLRCLKYVVLVLLLVLPLFVKLTPFFCKYVCPQGIVEGAMPMVAVNKGIRAAMGTLFSWKLTVLGIILLLSIFIYRPFCKWLCPLGAFYALFNKIALLRIRVDSEKCIECGKCIKVCKMDVDVTKTPNHSECIRCGRCISRCPQDAVSYCFGLKKEYKNH